MQRLQTSLNFTLDADLLFVQLVLYKSISTWMKSQISATAAAQLFLNNTSYRTNVLKLYPSHFTMCVFGDHSDHVTVVKTMATIYETSKILLLFGHNISLMKRCGQFHKIFFEKIATKQVNASGSTVTINESMSLFHKYA